MVCKLFSLLSVCWGMCQASRDAKIQKKPRLCDTTGASSSAEMLTAPAFRYTTVVYVWMYLQSSHYCATPNIFPIAGRAYHVPAAFFLLCQTGVICVIVLAAIWFLQPFRDLFSLLFVVCYPICNSMLPFKSPWVGGSNKKAPHLLRGLLCSVTFCNLNNSFARPAFGIILHRTIPFCWFDM